MTDTGQTNVDFLVGMSVFLLSVAFVFGMIPGIFEPFSTDGGSNTLVADRAAATLAEGTLGSPSEPTVLNATCTHSFFEGDEGAIPDGCRFDTVEPNAALGIPDTTGINATIESAEETTYATGDAPPERSANVVVSRRTVTLDEQAHRLIVRVW